MAVGSHGIIIFMILAFTKVRSPDIGRDDFWPRPPKGLIDDGFVLQETFWFWVDLIKHWRTPMLVRLTISMFSCSRRSALTFGSVRRCWTGAFHEHRRTAQRNPLHASLQSPRRTVSCRQLHALYHKLIITLLASVRHRETSIHAVVDRCRGTLARLSVHNIFRRKLDRD